MDAVELPMIIAHGIWLLRYKICFKARVTDLPMVTSKAFTILASHQKVNNPTMEVVEDLAHSHVRTIG